MKLTESAPSLLDTAGRVSTHLLREPVKQAVREALRDEAVTVERVGRTTDSRESSGSGGSTLLVAVGALAVGGAVYYFLRKNTSSVGWSTGSETTSHERGEFGSADSQRTAGDGNVDDSTGTSRRGGPGSSSAGSQTDDADSPPATDAEGP